LDTHTVAFVAKGPLRKRLTLILAVALFLSVAVLVVTFLRQKACAEARMVLVGDSITALWQNAATGKELAGLRIVNRGVPGNETANMLSRFNHDAIRLGPKVVVIQGGINDFVRVPLSSTEQNLQAMAEMAERNGIRVVLATVLPTGKHESAVSSSAQDSGHEKVRMLNDWIKDFAARKHFALVDYHFALADDRGFYLEGFTVDGIHPTAQGYARMEPLLRDAVQAAARGGK
jgi:Lysophospholipase L1 and related esterases